MLAIFQSLLNLTLAFTYSSAEMDATVVLILALLGLLLWKLCSKPSKFPPGKSALVTPWFLC